MYVVKIQIWICISILYLWFICIYNFNIISCRIWYSDRTESRRHAIQIGYRNCLPQCLNMGFIYPKYEDLGSLYARLNNDVLERPLEGMTMSMLCIFFYGSSMYLQCFLIVLLNIYFNTILIRKIIYFYFICAIF